MYNNKLLPIDHASELFARPVGVDTFGLKLLLFVPLSQGLQTGFVFLSNFDLGQAKRLLVVVVGSLENFAHVHPPAFLLVPQNHGLDGRPHLIEEPFGFDGLSVVFGNEVSEVVFGGFVYALSLIIYMAEELRVELIRLVLACSQQRALGVVQNRVSFPNRMELRDLGLPLVHVLSLFLMKD